MPRTAFTTISLATVLVAITACGSTSSANPKATTAPAAVSTTVVAMAPTTTVSMMAADKPFGPACGAVPLTGAGSFDGMAKDPTATAASNNPLLSTLVAAVTAAGLGDTLNSAGPFTVFAPTNDAFAKIDKSTLDKLLADPKGDLTKILTYHVVAGQRSDADSLVKSGSVKTVNGGAVMVSKVGDSYTVNGAKVLCGNVQTANATVFIIDTVLVPA